MPYVAQVSDALCVLPVTQNHWKRTVILYWNHGFAPNIAIFFFSRKSLNTDRILVYATLATPRWLRHIGYATLVTPRWLRHVGYATLATPRTLSMCSKIFCILCLLFAVAAVTTHLAVPLCLELVAFPT